MEYWFVVASAINLGGRRIKGGIYGASTLASSVVGLSGTVFGVWCITGGAKSYIEMHQNKTAEENYIKSDCKVLKDSLPAIGAGFLAIGGMGLFVAYKLWNKTAETLSPSE